MARPKKVLVPKVTLPPPATILGGGKSILSTDDEERLARAWRAVEEFRRQLPRYQAYARALTRDPSIQVIMDFGTPRTDGRFIYMRPPIEFGDRLVHPNRDNCEARSDKDRLLCESCAVLEDAQITVYHEIAHIVFGSFQELGDADKADLVVRAVTEAGGSSKRAALIAERVAEHNPTGFMQAANLVSPFLGVILNAFEDARVNRAMYEARPGTKVMFRGMTVKVFEDGITDSDGTHWRWDENPPDAQAIVGLFAKASGYDYSGWFLPEVEAFLDKPDTTRLVNKMLTARSAKAVYRLGFPALEALRSHGFCKSREDDEEEEEEPPVGDPADDEDEDGKPENESDDADDQDTESGDDDCEGNDGDNADGTQGDDPENEPEGDDETESDDVGDGAASDDDDDEATEASDDDDDDDDGTEASDDEGDDEATEASDDDQGEASDDDGGDDDQGDQDGDEASDDGGDDDEGDQDGDDGDDAGDWDDDGDEATDDGGDDDEDDYGDDEDHDPDVDDTELDEDADGDDGDEQDGDDEGDDNGDSGCDSGMLPDNAAERAEAAQRALDGFGGHAPSLPGEEAAEQQIHEDLARAGAQSEHLDTASAALLGVNVYEYDGPASKCQWESRVWGTRGQPIIRVEDGVLSPALLAMRTTFQENRAHKFERNLRRGRIDAAALGRRAGVGDDRLFRKRTIPGRKDYFVVIGLDVSGSTAYGAVNTIKAAAMAQAELLTRMGIPFAMYAHSGSPSRTYNGSGYQQAFTLDLFVIKAAEESWTDKTRQRLSDLEGGANNLDGHTLEFYRKVCDRRTETDRVVMYYTDGQMPAENYHEELTILRRELGTCAAKGYTVMGVGVGNDEPSNYGLPTVRIDRVQDATKVVEFLRAAIAS